MVQLLAERPGNILLIQPDPLSQLFAIGANDGGIADIKTPLISIPEDSTPSGPYLNLEPTSISDLSSTLNTANIFHYLLGGKRKDDEGKKCSTLFSRKTSHKYSVEQKITDIAKSIIPTSTQPTAEQKLKRSIREAWEKRFTPERCSNKLYVSGVLYAKRARFFKTDNDFWKLDNSNIFTDRVVTHDPLEDYYSTGKKDPPKKSYSIQQFSIFLRKDSVQSIADSMASNKTEKTTKTLDRRKSRSMLSISSVDNTNRGYSDTDSVKRGAGDRRTSYGNVSEGKTSFCNLKLSTQKSQQPEGPNSASQRDNLNAPRDLAAQLYPNPPEKKRRNVAKKVKSKNDPRFVLPTSGHMQTFERRRTRPDESMYKSIDPMVLNKNKLSKAFCDQSD